MTKYTVVLLAAAIAACSSSTSPGSNNNNNTGNTGQKPPSTASKGNTVDLSGTYNLSQLAIDSSDGGTATQSTDANDGATLTLTTSTYQLTAVGNFGQTLNSTHGSYVATDTSSSAQRGTLVLNDSVAAKTENAQYTYANSTLTVSIPNGSGQGNAVITTWIKQ